MFVIMTFAFTLLQVGTLIPQKGVMMAVGCEQRCEKHLAKVRLSGDSEAQLFIFIAIIFT